MSSSAKEYLRLRRTADKNMDIAMQKFRLKDLSGRDMNEYVRAYQVYQESQMHLFVFMAENEITETL